MTYTITLLNASGCPIAEDRPCYTLDRDPFEKQSRALLQAAHLYHERGGRRQRLVTLEASQQVKDKHGRPLPHHLPETVKEIVVQAGHRDRPETYYLARYIVLPLRWQSVTLAIPEGRGNAFPEHGDFTDFELQPFAAEFAHSLWDVDGIYLRPLEPLPYADDSDEACRMALVLGRTSLREDGKTVRFPQERVWLHYCGRNLRPAKVAVVGSRIRPVAAIAASGKAAKKGRRQ